MEKTISRTCAKIRSAGTTETFCDYGIMNPGELMPAVREGVDFWNDLEVEDPEMKLMYRVFNGN